VAEKQESAFDLPSFAASAQKQIKQFSDAQSELFGLIQETNQHWLNGVQDQMKLASEYASKLSAARSIPDAMTTWQEWGSREVQIVADNTLHLLSDTQNVMQKSAHLLSNGWQSEGSGLSK
jgi:hypothetical protein